MFPLLETLVAVYEVGQFTLAADELKVSQSTVSSRIAQLEQMVGAPLFVRNAKSDVTPTQAGRMLYQTAIGIDGLWRDTREQIALTLFVHQRNQAVAQLQTNQIHGLQIVPGGFGVLLGCR